MITTMAAIGTDTRERRILRRRTRIGIRRLRYDRASARANP
ncbi:hypothetical protein AB0H00_18380 [Nocardia sp. NPDC023852]